jgi:hypothetical protein
MIDISAMITKLRVERKNNPSNWSPGVPEEVNETEEIKNSLEDQNRANDN